MGRQTTKWRAAGRPAVECQTSKWRAAGRAALERQAAEWTAAGHAPLERQAAGWTAAKQPQTPGEALMVWHLVLMKPRPDLSAGDRFAPRGNRV